MPASLDWDSQSDDEKPALVEQSDSDDDWENQDLSDEEREEQRKRDEEEQKRRDAEEEKRRQKEAEKNRGPQKKSHASSKTTGMYKKYNEAQADLDTASDLFAGSGFEQLHVELLEPASKKDFQDYGQIVGDMIVKHAHGGKDYQAALNDIITRATKFYSIKDLKALKSHLDTLILVKSNEKKGPQQQKKVYSKVESAIPDQLGSAFLEGVPDTKAEALELTAEEEYDSGDDFM